MNKLCYSLLVDIIKRFVILNTFILPFSMQVETDLFATFSLTMAVCPLHFFHLTTFSRAFKGTHHILAVETALLLM